MDRLNVNDSITLGQELISGNGQARLVLQGDHNLVLYRVDTGAAIWATNTVGSGADTLIMQGDGNLVLYRPGNHPVWAVNPHDHAGRSFVVQGDGNAVLWADGYHIWATNTGPTRAKIVERIYQWDGLPPPGPDPNCHRFPDGDDILLSGWAPKPTPTGPPTNESQMRIWLEVGPAVSWWKGIEVRDWHDDPVAHLWTQDNRRTDVSSSHSMGYFSYGRLILSKAKAFGIHTTMYDIRLPLFATDSVNWVPRGTASTGGPPPQDCPYYDLFLGWERD